MLKEEKILGVILAGGQSARFGSNKAFALYDGVPIIHRVLKAMQEVFAETFLITNTPEVYRHLPLPVYQDLLPQRGPMGGLVTAFSLTHKEKIFVVACDLPLLDPALIECILKEAQNFDAIIPVSEQEEYLMAVYSHTLFAGMRQQILTGERSLKKFLAGKPNIHRLNLHPHQSCNINTPQDLARLEAHAH
ncbi:MAG: molybdenum cofactor guanylyltransferase [Deltaproteobacteria bacterium]|nr:molybdenum cofactor guanylyltransferase [Deltaproteobacteria bacterium]